MAGRGDLLALGGNKHSDMVPANVSARRDHTSSRSLRDCAAGVGGIRTGDVGSFAGSSAYCGDPTGRAQLSDLFRGFAAPGSGRDHRRSIPSRRNAGCDVHCTGGGFISASQRSIGRGSGNCVTRRTLLFMTACSVSGLGASGTFSGSPGGVLNIRVSGLRNSEGVVGAAVFQSPRGWPEDHHSAYRRGAALIAGSEAMIEFEHLPAGRYAVVVLHDENSNEKLDRNFLGF